jgi:hypothetical protein
VPNILSVKASAKIVAKPSTACLILYAAVDAERPSAAIQGAAEIASNAAEKLRSQFPEITDIAISDFKIGEKEIRNPLDAAKKKPLCEAIRLVVIKSPPDPLLAGRVLDAALECSLQTNGPKLFGAFELPTALIYLADSQAMEHQAVMEAIAVARRKADRLAKALGRKIGEPVSFPATYGFDWSAGIRMKGLVEILGDPYFSRSPLGVEFEAHVTVEFELL